MKKSLSRKVLFVCLVFVSLSCFAYLSFYDIESDTIANHIELSKEIHANTVGSVNVVKIFVTKILEILTLNF